jgi:hypothetical protein
VTASRRYPRRTYRHKAKGAVRYVPVTLRGELIGCLWAAEKENAAGFVRKLDGPKEAFRAPLVWSHRLGEAADEGLEPVEVLNRWRGAPEDPEGGTIAPDAPEATAEDNDALGDLLNPGYVDPLKDYFTKEPTLPDGTPMFRPSMAEPLGPMVLPETDYRSLTDQPVRYLPVVLGGRTVGYLWASVTDDAAHFKSRGDAGAVGKNAGVPWVLRLREAGREGLTPLQALRRWKGAPEDPQGGAIPADAEERVASSVDALKLLTGDYASSTADAVRYLPVVLGGRTVGYLWASLSEDAASFLARPDAGADGVEAGALWVERLRESVREGLTSVQALRRWHGAPEDPRGGVIPADAEEQEAPSLRALEELSRE